MTRRALGLQLVFALCTGLSAISCYADLASELVDCKAITAVAEEEEYSNVIVGDCPRLIAALESSFWEGVLEPGWRENLTYWEMIHLEHLVLQYNAEASPGSAISLSSLDEIVAALEKPDLSAKETLWNRFISWLESFFVDDAGGKRDWIPDWLDNFTIPDLVAKIIFWTLAAVVIISAIVVVIIEIRAVRKPALTGATRPGKTGTVDDSRFEDRLLTLRDVDEASLDDKPSILLRLLMQRLEARGMAPHRPAWTHRELSTSASGLGGEAGEAFSRVSASAEQIRFSAKPLEPPEISRVVLDGVALLGKLEPGQA